MNDFRTYKKELFNSSECSKMEIGNYIIKKLPSDTFIDLIRVYEHTQGFYDVLLTTKNKSYISEIIEKLATSAGFEIDLDAMKTLGGSFEYALAEAYLKADKENGEKLLKTFPKEFGKYKK